ncbi:hypothetical protein D3C83_151830 [compost metagenome]
MRAASQTMPTIDSDVRTIDSAISQSGGCSTEIRMIMIIGVKIGISEMTRATVESGLEMKKNVA